LRCFLLVPRLLRQELFVRSRLALLFELLHVVAKSVDEIVGELLLALPRVAQQVQIGLLGFEVAQVVGSVEVGQTCVVEEVLLRDREPGQQRLGDAVQRFQLGALFPLPCHLPPAEILGVLFEGGQFGERIVAFQQLGQRGLGRIVQHRGEQIAQAPAFGGQRFADQILQGRIAGPHDLLLVEPDNQLGDDETGRDVAPYDLRGLLRELR
jgi:hypothetical protein